MRKVLAPVDESGTPPVDGGPSQPNEGSTFAAELAGDAFARVRVPHGWRSASSADARCAALDDERAALASAVGRVADRDVAGIFH